MTSTIVMKFGGTSVGSTERIGESAKRVASHVRESKQRVVVVASAMSGETNRLIELARKVWGEKIPPREYHQLVTSGEQASVALVALALNREGIPAKPLLAYQVPIRTKEAYGQDLISEVGTEVLRGLLAQGIVPVVAGFQGINEVSEYTTLGRGGSDTTAVALAAALDSCPCKILTDVDGVFTALPSICKRARKLKAVSYEEMLELASSGAKVLQTRSVNLAYKYRVPLEVCSSFSNEEGTMIVEEYEGMEDAVVSGITYRTDEAKLTLRDLPDAPGVASSIFSVLAQKGIVVDMIVQSKGTGGKASISFTCADVEAQSAYDALVRLVHDSMPGAGVELDRDIAKLSVVGEGMRTHAGVASKMFDVLGREGVNVELISTSEIKISVAIKEKYSELAVRALHECFIESGGC